MAIRIVRNNEANCINFEGSSVPAYFNACLSASVIGDEVHIKNDIRSKLLGEDFFEFSNIPFTEFEDKDGNPFLSAQETADYITLNGNVAAPTDVNVGYKGVYDATSNSPDISNIVHENGDWYFVSVEGTQTLSGISYNLKINDIVKWNDTTSQWNVIEDKGARISDIENSSLAEYDIYVDADYTGTVRTGSSVHPYVGLTQAINNSFDGASILIKGNILAVNDSLDAFTLPVDKSLSFYGANNASVGYVTYEATNGNVFYGGAVDKSYEFHNLTIKNAGEYGVRITSAAKTVVEDCILSYNGWNGTALNTVLGNASTGLLGFDSDSTSLQNFYTSSNASNGGAMRIEKSTVVEIIGNTVSKNLRGIRLQDCGVGGAGFVTRNISTQNIESGIYLAAGSTHYGCQNIIVTINSSAYNANNGLLCIGGINNKFSQNEVNGNWNAGFCAWGSANTTLRDCGLYDNNRSQFNGIGNIGDAKASIQINEAYDYLGTTISINPAARFIAEILDTQVHYTGLGSNTERVGFLITEGVGDLADNDKNIIKVDDVGFIGQDYAIDFSEVDLTNLHVALGDNSFMSIGEKAVRQPLAGEYYELPFSNHVTKINYADFSVDATGNINILEGVGGMKLNPYKVNDLQAIADGTEIRVILKDSNKVQFNVPVSGCSIDGSYVNSVLNQALLQLNNLFTNTDGFASGGGNPVTGFDLVSNDLTLTLEDGTSFTVDVTTLGVDSNNFVVSGEVVGSDLVLTMTDGSTVTIDAQNMINGSSLSALGQNWFISYGANAGTQLGNPTSGNLSYNNAPIYYGEKLEVGTEFMWTQYSLINNASVFMSIGVWAGATDDVTGASSTVVTNWSTKFGFFYDKLMEDTSTFNNGGYSSKNTDLGSGGGTGTVYANGSIMRLVYGSDYRLRLYVNDVLTATTIVPESGNDLDIQLIASNNGVEFPNFIKRTTNWTIVHDLDNSENNDILNGIEEDTVLETNFEIEVGEKAMVNLSGFGRSHRIGLDYTGAFSGNSNPYSDVESPIVYGTSEQIIAQNTGEWSFNTSSLYYTAGGNGKWNVPSANAGMVSFRYHNDNSMDLYSETYGEVIATKLTNLDGTPFKVTISANENVPNFNDLPTLSKQTIGQGFQPRTTYAPNVSNQSVDATEADTLNYQIVATDYIVNQYVAENAPSWMSINQDTGVLSGNVPAYVGDATDIIVVNCKAGNAVGGTTNFTVTINVQEFTYTNTKSLRFAAASSAYLTGNAASMNVMQRASNGSGASDAWSMSMWVRLGGNSATSTLFNYGGDSTLNAGGIVLTQQSVNNLVFTYGSGANYIGFVATNSVTPNTWHHILITYDGGTTGAASGSLGDYYSRFKLVIDDVTISPTFLQSNYGYTGSIPATNLYIGRNVFSGSNLLKYARVNQIAFWNSNEFSNRSDIYNSGNTQDLRGLAFPPSHYYEMESSVTTITDMSGSANLSGYNFITIDLVTDTP